MDTLENPMLKEEVKKDSPLKTYLVEYVGNQLRPQDGIITAEMMVEVLAKEFPELILAIAEENFLRGYEQALADVESEERVGKKFKKRK
jgi:hypothetical protein